MHVDVSTDTRAQVGLCEEAVASFLRAGGWYGVGWGGGVGGRGLGGLHTHHGHAILDAIVLCDAHCIVFCVRSGVLSACIVLCCICCVVLVQGM